MVKKRVTYNLDKLMEESEHRVLNEHEIIYILGKLMLSETVDEEINSRSKWNPKRWMWQFQKIMDARQKNQEESNKLIASLDQIAKTDPDYAIKILNTPDHSLSQGLSAWQKHQLKSRYRRMSLDKSDKEFTRNRYNRVGIRDSQRFGIKSRDKSYLQYLLGSNSSNPSKVISQNVSDTLDREGPGIKQVAKYPSGALGSTFYPKNPGIPTKHSVFTTPENMSSGYLGPLSEGNGGQVAPVAPKKQYVPDPKWVASLIQQLNLTPGDILSGNKLDLRKPSHLNLVNYYRQSKSLAPITQSGLTQDELKNNEGKYTDLQTVRANDKKDQNAYLNMKDIQDFSSDLLDANKVDYSSGKGNVGWVRRGLRSIGDWIKYGKEGDPNRTFKATAGGLNQDDIDERVGKIRELMRWFKIPGENNGEITNRQIYAFMNDVKQPVLVLANGTQITKLQLMTLMKAGKVDPRTYMDIIQEYGKEKKPVSLARDKVPVMERRWNPETRKYEMIQKVDKNGQPMFRAATDEDLKLHRNQYVGRFSALDQKWQNTVNGFVNPNTNPGRNPLLPKPPSPPKKPLPKNFEHDANGLLTAKGKQDYKAALAQYKTELNKYNQGLNSAQFSNDMANKAAGDAIATTGFSSLDPNQQQAEIARRNMILTVLHKNNLQVTPEIVADISKTLSTNSQPTDADIRNAYAASINSGKQTGFAAFANRTQARDISGNPLTLTNPNSGVTIAGAPSRYSESFTSELAGLVFIEAFAQYLLSQKKVLREGNEAAVAANDPNNPVDQAFSMVKPQSEQIPQDEEDTSAADDDYYNAAVQAYQQSQQANNPAQPNQIGQSDRARGAQWGVNLVDKAHSWLTGVRDNFEIKQVRSSNPHLFALTQYALANPLSPRANSPEVQQYLTTSELEKIKRAQNRWISRFPDKTPPWIVPGEDDDGSEASGMTQQQAQGQGPQGQVQPSPTSAGSEAIQADQDSSAPNVKKDPYAFDINKKFDPNNLKNFFYTDKYGRLISAVDKQPIESKQRVNVSDLKPEAQEFFYNNKKYYKKNKNGSGSQTSAGTSLLDRLYRTAASVSRQIPGNRSKMNGGKEKITITQSNKKDTNSFKNLFSRIQAGSIRDYNSNNFPIMDKFELDPSGQELRVKAANGNPAKTVVSLKDTQLSNVELARYASDGRPILIVHKKDKVGRPFTKTIDLTKFSESANDTDILTYSQFKKQFKESIQKHSNEVSSKNMYQLYLLGKLKKLL